MINGNGNNNSNANNSITIICNCQGRHGKQGKEESVSGCWWVLLVVAGIFGLMLTVLFYQAANMIGKIIGMFTANAFHVMANLGPIIEGLLPLAVLILGFVIMAIWDKVKIHFFM